MPNLASLRLHSLAALCAAAAAACGAPSPHAPDALAPDASAPDAPASDAPASDAPAPDAAMPGEPLPAFDAETEAHVRDLVARGAARGNRPGVFAKIGDSITESRAFLFECGDGAFRPGPHADLAPAVRYFSATPLPDERNAFTREGHAAVGGWAAADAIEGGDASPLVSEIDAIRPQWALVMYGTNDLERVDVATYRANLARALDLLEARDVVPVLSTIPPRTDRDELGARVGAFNDAVRALARARHVPWMDYWAALVVLPGFGLSADGVHPDVYMEGTMSTCDLGDDALRHGYNVRNFLALQMLRRLMSFAPPMP